MTYLGPLLRGVLGLPELELRIRWLEGSLLELGVEPTAQLVNALCEESTRGTPAAREVLLPLCLLLVRRRESAWLGQLREAAHREALLSLVRLVPRLPVSSEGGFESVRPVPDYGLGREPTLGERRSLARRHDRDLLSRLLGDPHPLVIRQLLENPRLTETDLVRLVTRRPPNLEAVAEVFNTEFLARSRVRMAVVQNPGMPLDVSAPLLALCSRTELRGVLRASDTPAQLRALALEHFERRPPVLPGAPPGSSLH